MTKYWGSGGIVPHIIDLGTGWSEWLGSRPGRFTPREGAPRTYCIGGCVGPRVGLEAVVRRKIPSPYRKSNPRIQIVQPVAQRYID
jgi:hypothetical protein